MQTTISNEFLTVTIDTHGAEVVSVKNSKGEELIWQADPAIWDRHSPVLFPWAGRLANGELVHNGKHYSGGQHGFIRDLEHILKQNNGISAQLMFRADEETKTLRFPFDFEFTSVFTLDGHTLHHEVHVKNCGDENMPGVELAFIRDLIFRLMKTTQLRIMRFGLSKRKAQSFWIVFLMVCSLEKVFINGKIRRRFH